MTTHKINLTTTFLKDKGADQTAELIYKYFSGKWPTTEKMVKHSYVINLTDAKSKDINVNFTDFDKFDNLMQPVLEKLFKLLYKNFEFDEFSSSSDFRDGTFHCQFNFCSPIKEKGVTTKLLTSSVWKSASKRVDNNPKNDSMSTGGCSTMPFKK